MLVIQPGKKAELWIRFSPLSESLFENQILLTTNNPDAQTVAISLSGRGIVALSSDFSGDRTVDFSDFVLFAQRFGASLGATNFDARFDLDGDKTIGFGDFVFFAQQFGKKVTKSVSPSGLQGRE